MSSKPFLSSVFSLLVDVGDGLVFRAVCTAADAGFGFFLVRLAWWEAFSPLTDRPENMDDTSEL